MKMHVTVVGLVPETVQLPDIGYDVPHGVVVHIPVEKANNSKDLWRALSQRRVFRLQAGPFSPAVGQPPNHEVEQLRARVAELEAEVQRLRAEQGKKTQEAQSGQGKLDEILLLLRAGGSAPAYAQAPAARPLAPVTPSGVVEVETPAFIPSTFKSEASETRVSVEETASESGGVSGARSALRKLRRGE